MKYGNAVVALACGVSPALSQDPVANPSLATSAGGVRDAAHARDIALRRFDVAVRLNGSVSETTITASFANAGRDVLEGDFRLALPRNAVVTGYALDIGGSLVDGVLVDQPKAKAVYEAQVRRRVDPGLAEVAADGGFRTRVFPIPAGGGRTIRVRFVAPLGVEGYRLPLRFAAPSEGWTVKIAATGLSSTPTLLMPDGSVGRWRGDGQAADAAGKNALNGAIVIGPVATTDTIVSRHRSGERFVQIEGVLPPIGPAPSGGTLRIYWDRSRSRLGDRHDAEYALVRRTIAAERPRRIEIVTFASDGVMRSVADTPDAAIETLRGVRYRGATSFAGAAGDGSADHCLLFSDGRPTIDRASAFSPSCRVDAVTTSAVADMGWLRHLATRLGGQAFALGEDGSAVAAALSAGTTGVTAIVDEDGNALPFAALETAAGRWRVVARAPAVGGIRVRVAGQEIVRSLGEAVAFDGDGALVGFDMVATLGGTEQRADYVATSRRYEIASPSLSFLVLERPEDYIAADVAPPASYPSDALSLYLERRKRIDGARADEKQEALSKITQDWAAQVAWWKQRFDPVARGSVKKRGNATDSRSAEAMALPPPPPPPPAPAPEPSAPPVVYAPQAPSAPQAPPAPRQTGSSEAADVVVTGSIVKPSTPAVSIDSWQPDREYLRVFDAAPGRFDERFGEAERQAGGVPAFYLDSAEWLRRHGRIADAVQTALSALGLPAANATTLGIVADRLERYGALDRAIELRERQAALEPDRPQPKRLLALAIAARAAARPETAAVDLARAIALLREVAVTPWDERWEGIGLIALMEANALVPRLKQLGGRNPLEPVLTALLDTDIRVVVDWTTDATDLDLWIDEPSGERAIYNHPRTATGGNLSNDMTAGYGPEAYFLRRAPGGTYVVQANVYAADRLDPNGLSLLTAHLFRNFGRPTQRVEAVDIELQRDERGEKMIGRIAVPKGKPVATGRPTVGADRD
ncbi:MAG TPA: VIT domain-containing protein [Sphingomonas sp.]|nr:VIT domain-containing protein [Sphingomonas sp.]